MSLINQMLRDLQQQKKDGGPEKPSTLRPKKMERIPFLPLSLPLPLVLGGAALALLCLIWWMAGALSDLMFGFEPTARQAESQQVAVAEESSVIDNNLVVVAEQDQLTVAEREAERPVAQAASQQQAKQTPKSANLQPAPVATVIKVPETRPVAAKRVAAVAKASRAPVAKRKLVTAPARVTKTPRLVQKPRKTVAKAPKRLHPDELPGAIQSSSRALPEPKVIDRPSRVPATTPYGMAEEAYLDGKWAFERERANLAVRSLQHALELYPGHLPARELLVEIFGKKGKAGEAMFLLAEGLEIAPDYIVFKKKYARLLVEQGDYDLATKVMLDGGLPTVADDPEAHVVLASLYQRLGEPFLAAQTYRNLLVVWPQTGAFWVGLGGSLEGQHLSVAAVECYQKALKTKNLRKDLAAYAKKRLSVLN